MSDKKPNKAKGRPIMHSSQGTANHTDRQDITGLDSDFLNHKLDFWREKNPIR